MNIARRVMRSLAKRALDYSGGTLWDAPAWMLRALGVTPVISGANVNPWSAIRNSAVHNAVNIISQPIGFVPFNIMERQQNGDKKKAVDHPAYRLLHDQPNKMMTAVVFRETMQAHILLWGNAYAEIQWGADGYPIAFWPLSPNCVTPQVVDNKLWYVVVEPRSGAAQLLPSGDVIHIPGLSFDGICGRSIISCAKEAIGLGLAAEEYASRFYVNGTMLTGVLEHPGQLSKDAADRLRKSLGEKHTGLSNAHRVMILEEGLKMRDAMPMRDAQFLEGRNFQIDEVARFFNIPLYKLKRQDKPTYASIEQEAIEFNTMTMGPWWPRWEQEFDRKIFSAQERRRFYSKFNVNALLRGDMSARFNAYAVGISHSFITPNMIADWEDWNSFGPEGDKRLIATNTVPEGSQVPAQPKVKPAGPGDAPGSQQQSPDRTASGN